MVQRAILIHGPTASGKTALAVMLAKKLSGEIINADAMQVYKDLPILSARPVQQDMQDIAHYGFGHVDAATQYSVANWLEMVRDILPSIHVKGRVPIIVGGTGLYLLALTEGLAIIPDIPADARAKARSIVADGNGVAQLNALDPKNTICASDKQRIARALEVYFATGLPLRHFYQDRPNPVLAPEDWCGFVLMPARQALYARIDKRFAYMLEQGGLAEAQAFMARDLDPQLPVMKAHGLPRLLAHLRGEVSLEEANDLACRDTRRYAKRQYTWIAHQFARWIRVPAHHSAQPGETMVRIYADMCCVKPELTPNG